MAINHEQVLVVWGLGHFEVPNSDNHVSLKTAAACWRAKTGKNPFKQRLKKKRKAVQARGREGTNAMCNERAKSAQARRGTNVRRIPNLNEQKQEKPGRVWAKNPKPETLKPKPKPRVKGPSEKQANLEHLKALKGFA